MDQAQLDQFKILKDLPEQPDNDYAVDNIVDAEWLANNIEGDQSEDGNGDGDMHDEEMKVEKMKVEET
ncbi:hypothetical protein EW026_g7368 [Hermanssonia centrifuga]|uniref:Uncharacterized protein n=1 Tax=Hermanssonia centrifuga TaxID=98765 RepID=A0A4S4K819_9APHY|nr:hypothetical protein EW026_g7368 [Hermanssonia centrifuga]